MPPIITPQRITVEQREEIDQRERAGLNIERWLCERPESPLIHDRTRYRDAIDARTLTPSEIKGCKFWNEAAQATGQWRFRYPQHQGLKQRDGYYILVVYEQRESALGDEQLHLHPRRVTSLTPAEVEELHGGELAWSYVRDEHYGRIRVSTVPWPAVLGEAAGSADVKTLFTRPTEPAGLAENTDFAHI